MNDNPCRTPPPLQQARHAPRMPELFGPRPDRYLQPVKLKYFNDIRTPRPSTFPLPPAHMIRHRLNDIFELLDDPDGAWEHINEFLLQIPQGTRNDLISQVAASMILIEHRTKWRMPPENFCLLLSDAPQHIKIWLTDGLSPRLGLETFGFYLARAHREALIAGKFKRFDCDRDFPEVTALYNGPDAVRAYAAKGGTFTVDLSHTGMTLAHVAATSTYQWSAAVSTFIATGGEFHHRPDRLGRTPVHTLINEASSPDAIRMAAAAGVLVTADQAAQRDRFGCSLLDCARTRGQEFVDALTALTLSSDGAS